MIDKIVSYFSDLELFVIDVFEVFKVRGVMFVIVELCMGGLICGVLIEIVGLFVVVDCGFVIYFNEVKIEMFGVLEEMIRKVGVVSKEVVIVMVEGVLFKFRVFIVVFVIGIVGFGGGSVDKFVGIVYMVIVICGWLIFYMYCWFVDWGWQVICFEIVKIVFIFILNFMEQIIICLFCLVLFFGFQFWYGYI